MMSHSTRRRLTVVACAAVVLAPNAMPVRAATKFPQRPIQFVIAFPPGSNSDNLARLLATEVSRLLAVPVIVENRPGASSMLAARQVAKAKPGDGHVLLLGNSPLWMVQPVIESNPGYTFEDFEHLMMLGETPFVLLARHDSPWIGVADMVADARKRPGEITFGSTGIGGGAHLGVELLMERAGISLRHIPYRGPTQAQMDLIGGQIDLQLDSVTTGMAGVRAGRLKALGLTTRERLAAYPTVRTIAEQGYPGFSMYPWWSLATPAGTPPEVLDTLREAFAAALKSAPVASYFQANALLSTPTSREYLIRRIESESPVYRATLERLKIKSPAS